MVSQSHFYPPPGAIIVDTENIYFNWSDIQGTSKYWLQLDNNTDFSSPVVSDSNITKSNYTLQDNLHEDTYYWRIRAKTNSLWSNWSNTLHFYIVGIPTLFSPSEAYICWRNEEITFSWNELTFATAYNFELGNEFFSAIWVDTTTTASYLTLPQLPAVGIFYWRVRGIFGDIFGNWSEIRSLEICPYEIGYYDTPGIAYGSHISDNYAIIADGWTGLRIIDISDPSNPYEISYYDTPGTAFSLYISDNYAFVADGTSGLRIIDISDPSNPYEISYYDTPDYALGIHVSGDYTFVADNDAGLRIIDISDPSNPYEISYYNTPGNASNVYTSGGFAFVADGYSGLRIIDISDQSSPYEIGYYDTPDNAHSICVFDNYAFVADGLSGLRIIRVKTQ